VSDLWAPPSSIAQSTAPRPAAGVPEHLPYLATGVAGLVVPLLLALRPGPAPARESRREIRRAAGSRSPPPF
jgi:hypothetical protein